MAIDKDIKGVHSLYLHTGSKAVNFFSVRFHKKPSADDVYKDYDPDELVFSDIASSEYRTDINVIAELGLTATEDDAEMYYPENLVTRGRFIEVVHAVTGDIEATSDGAPFADIAKGSEHYDAACALKQMGLISGFGDGTFRPDDFIAVQDAVSVICRLLGYDTLAQGRGGYALGYLSVAMSEGVLDGLPSSGYVTEGILARLIKNAIDAPYYDVASLHLDGSVSYELNADGILSKYMNIYRVEGQVVMNNVTGLSGPETDFEDSRVMIGDETYLVDQTQARSLIGFECEAYYLDMSDDRLLISIRPLETVEITDIYSNVDGISSIGINEIVYEDASGKERKLRLDSGSHILYNGVAVDDALSNLISKPFRGRLRYIDNRYARDVLVIDEYINIIIGSASKSDGLVYDELANKKYTFTDDDGIYFTKGGATAIWGDISTGDVAMLYMSKNTKGNKLARLVVAKDTVTGTVDEISGDDITVGGTVYKLASECTETVTVGKTLELKVNDYGEIVAFTEVTGDANKLSWLIDVDNGPESGFNKIQRIKVLDADNEIREYELASTCTVDGRRYTDNTAVLNAAMKEAPVRYQLSSKGYVTEMDTIVVDTGNDKDKMVLAMGETSPLYWSSGSRIFMCNNDGLNRFIFAQNGQILGKWDNAESSEDYEWTTTASLTADGMTGSAYSSTGFENGYADVFLFTMKSADRSTTRAFAVEKISDAIDAEGEKCRKLWGYDGNKEVSYIASSEQPKASAIVNALEKGDFVSVVVDAKNVICDVRVIYLADEAAELQYTYNGTTESITPKLHATLPMGRSNKGYTDMRYVYGTVIDRNGKYVLLEHVETGATEYVHLGASTGIRVTKSSGDITLENGISTDNVMIGDRLVFEISGRATRCVYILEQ
ncbi:MAG: S-layer homology domain-containing protein, partial [Clostridia bacterium]|nr:S-layer homology domain-containing protein [Clostridia bacterium]